VPYGGAVTWPDGWAGRHEILGSDLAVARAAPFVGWRHGRLRLAGGLHVDVARLGLRRTLDFVDQEGDVELSLRGAGVGVDLAGFVRVVDGGSGRLDLGLSYKSRTRIALAGEADFTAPDAFSVKAGDQRASSELTVPDRLALGAAYRRGRFTVLADVELTAWQVHDAVAIDFAEEATPDLRQASDWRATVALRAGAEWRRGAWVARAGLSLDPSPAPAGRLTPREPDATRMGAALGVGRRLTATHALYAFYGHLVLLERASEYPDSMPARYGGAADLVGIGVTYAPAPP
jgi:long-subunit fatty acid transport protein